MDHALLENIRQLFKDDEELTITIASESPNSGHEMVNKLLEMERSYPPRAVAKDMDFNTVVDKMNL